MRVLIVNTSEKAGGAAVAANRLMDALNNNGVKAKMLVRDKVTDDITVVGLPRSLKMQWNLPVGALVRILASYFSKHRLLEVDMEWKDRILPSFVSFRKWMSSIFPGSTRACSH